MIRTRLPLLALLALASCDGGAAAPTPDDPCATHLAPGPDDQVAIQSALLEAAVGSVVCLEPGVYRLSDGLSLGVPGVALRAPAGRAVLDFSAQAQGAPGLQLLGDDLDVQGIEIRNTAGDGVRIVGADNVRLRRVRVTWGEVPPIPGARGVAVIQASNVAVESARIRGAAGPGIYVESSAGVAIDRTRIEGGPEGIVAQDSVDVILGRNRLALVPAPAEVGPAEELPPSDGAAAPGAAVDELAAP
ncbi:MAG TPA: right-handed parallel beta-helix repeat-containing protein [Vulgatibacter sp.]